MKKSILLVAMLGFVLGACSSRSHSHKTCPHKHKHHAAEHEKTGGENATGTEGSPSAPEEKAVGYGTDTGEPTQK